MTVRADSSTPANTRPAAIVPNWLPVLSGRQPQTNWRSFALRPEGTDDWLLVATTSGRGRVTCSDGEARMLGRGDMLLFRPGAPQDSGFADTTDTWFNTWIQFRPRPSWIEWLGWPEVDRGVSILKAGEDFEPIEVELNRLHDVASGASRMRLPTRRRNLMPAKAKVGRKASLARLVARRAASPAASASVTGKATQIQSLPRRRRIP